jgi:tetratricopeptide (TPR) repeat protein
MKKTLSIVIFFVGFQFAALAQLNTERVMSIGRNSLYFEDYVLAIQYFNQVIAVKPYLYEPFMYRGIAKIELDDFNGAEMDLNEAVRLNPFIPQALYARGFARQRLGKYSEAVEDFSKALEFSPENDVYLRSRMYANAQSDDFQAATGDLETLERMNPSNAEWLYERGRLSFYQKDTVAAEQSLLNYIKKDSTSSEVYSMLALLKMTDDDKKAKNYLDKAIELNSTFSGDYINRGILNVRNRKFMQALADYDKAIALSQNADGNSALLAYYNRGLLRASLGDNNNALSDLDKVVSIDSTFYDARLRRAVLYQTLRMYRPSIVEFNNILKKYPYFIPAYQGIAQAYDALGNEREAFLAREKAYNIDKNREKIRREQAAKNEQNTEPNEKEPTGGNVLSMSSEGISKGNNKGFFVRKDLQNTDNENQSKYENSLRGNVQDRYANVELERNFELNFYAKKEEIRRTPLYYIDLTKFNKEKHIDNELKLTNKELPLTETLVRVHFAEIEEFTKRITEHPTANLYFNRAIEFALVKDFAAAIDDLNQALILQPDFMLASFERANIRYKLTESKQTEDIDNEKDKKISKTQYQYDMEMVLRDYDKVISTHSDFYFAHFNRANVLCAVRDFQAAVQNYSKAIDIEPDFAEAYFNRGLAYLYMGLESKGLSDLSKAGELGIVEAYSLLKRYKK